MTSSVPAANEAFELPVNITSHFQVTVPSGGQAPSASSFHTPEQPTPAIKLASKVPTPVQSGGIASFTSSFPAAEQPRPAVKLASPFSIPMQSGGPAPSAYVTSSFLAGCGPMDLDTFMATELDKEMNGPHCQLNSV